MPQMEDTDCSMERSGYIRASAVGSRSKFMMTKRRAGNEQDLKWIGRPAPASGILQAPASLIRISNICEQE